MSQAVIERLKAQFGERILETHDYRGDDTAVVPPSAWLEVLVVMDSETKHLSPKLIGTIEDDEIKKAVCSIMEGGTDAFNMRSKRYQNVKTNG